MAKAKVKIVGDTKRPKDAVKKAVTQAVECRLSEVDKSIARLRSSLKYFESEHHLSTERFYESYLAGELEENIDYMEWRACKEILEDLLGEKALLEEISS
jgi:bacterioferritin (cytochrome b1)